MKMTVKLINGEIHEGDELTFEDAYATATQEMPGAEPTVILQKILESVQRQVDSMSEIGIANLAILYLGVGDQVFHFNTSHVLWVKWTGIEEMIEKIADAQEHLHDTEDE